MKVSSALLCDAATVREGLLNVLGGGITRVDAEMYPHPFQGALGMVFTAHPTESTKEHELEVILQSEDGSRLVDLTGTMQPQPGSDLQAGEEMLIPLAMGLGVVLPAAGRYSFEILVDGIHQVTLPFKATSRQEGPT